MKLIILLAVLLGGCDFEARELETQRKANVDQQQVIKTEANQLFMYEDKENGVLCYRPSGGDGFFCFDKNKLGGQK